MSRATTREQIMPLLEQYPDIVLAKRFGVTKQRINQIRQQAGIESSMRGYACPRVSNEETIANVIKLSEKHNMKQIARRLHVSLGVVSGICKSNGIECYGERVCRVHHDHEIIKSLIVKGKTARQIAADVGCSSALVFRLRMALKNDVTPKEYNAMVYERRIYGRGLAIT